MAMPPGVQAFRRSFAAGAAIHPPWVKYHPAFGEIPLHPPFVEPGVDVIHQLCKPLKDSAFASSA
jgi:hypothetical protein